MAPPPPPCRLCKSRCASSLATGKLFGIYFQPSFLHVAVRNYMKCNNYFIFSVGITALCHFAFFTQIVPCNVRLKLNKLTGDTMTFEAPGGPYTMEVEKGCNMSQIGGDGWARFLARICVTGGELISFSFRAKRLSWLSFISTRWNMMKMMRTHSMKMMMTHFMKPS